MSSNKLEIMRHSTSHLLASAVIELWPDTKLAIGPAVKDGFYYDLEFASPVSDADLPKIEVKMAEIKARNLDFVKKEISSDEANKIFVDQPFKLELIEDLKKEGVKKVLTYSTGKFIDLCIGPHVENTSDIGEFKLLSVAGAYWRGSEKNKMLTRIYGTCFPTQKELDEYLKFQEEAKKRDHRVIGKNLNLFVFSDLVGKGLPLFTEKGSVIRRELERFIVDEEIKRGYHHVYTPDLANVALYKKSGHYPYYKDTMYPVMKIDEEELILRPMTCPHHFQLYASRPRSYKELPIRYAELAKQFRYEKSGELTGLMRVRLFCLADAHIIAQKDQAVTEINNVLDLIEDVASELGLQKSTNYRYRLSLGDKENEKKFYKDNESWDFAENVLRQVLVNRSAPFYEEKGEAAFYGPKIDIQMKNFAGIENTAFTVQYDFVMPKRFNLTYIDEKGKEKEPIVIHRSSIGAIERVMAFLIEHYAGAFPVWLAPVQVKVIPVSEKSLEYAKSVAEKLQNEEIRTELDDRNEKMQAKIRDAEMEKIPYMLIIGPKEAEDQSVSVRVRGEKDLGKMSFNDFLQLIKEDIADKRQV
ncbi:threonine--tRNA ligase [Candidatus Shapirobacteria bacterium CG03_land_8_20_14_0_80_40_19]|uniref:Threonine--tRNA ligase n=4 Tax=Candidatus Shapironibacteriota TaxID=1752721 RepID=A0A2M7BE78_9BACT|nr:MAG: threonine--tRNA ligase [Candidatus Shapirobacteria bacterium CG11_big_fil_rev_8_21_14_0_20_40_12]PIV01411.1 MAG: threonine--tRNA ligase [Candidatus Shapirobacteria bacterium CG03_land_8_20_14_0_80_40_19]PJC29012.1 MAG: threonine--tRNA ligase [Candidatus Shapirobacteria bacterium CG_4_9_14_0_2_um_filter_40_11]PJC77347.1 MAG: threonine--tRNA ligase [Candidatus Shapirobacteria bacterium CG_4_8_14_3_um_filter_39_11]